MLLSSEYDLQRAEYLHLNQTNHLAMAAVNERISSGRIDIGMNEPMNIEMLTKFAAEYTGKSIQASAMPWAIMGAFFICGFFKPEIADLKKMFDYMFTSQYVAGNTLQHKYFGELPSVKDSVFRYCEQIGLPKATS